MDGVLNIYKTIGLTSFDVVRNIKKICDTGKVGHAGTLDPEASGVLPVCVGKGTKIIEFIMSNKKIYDVELLLGVVTDTYDREGKIISEKKVNVSEESIISAINSFIGEIDQVPPMYSALKVNGKKLYELARQGIEVERVPRRISIYNIEILDVKSPLINFRVTCSKGTYIRSLCYDIGEKLGCGGMMNKLERTATGIFRIENSVSIQELNKENVSKFMLSLDDALDEYCKIVVDAKFERLLINGVSINDKTLTHKINDNELLRVYNLSNQLIGLGIKTGGGFKITRLLV